MKNKLNANKSFVVVTKKGKVYLLKNTKTNRFMVAKKGLNKWFNHLGSTAKDLVLFSEDLAESTAKKRFRKMTK